MFGLMEVLYSSPTGTRTNRTTTTARKIVLKPICLRLTLNGMTKAVESCVTLAARLELVGNLQHSMRVIFIFAMPGMKVHVPVVTEPPSCELCV